ncbi:phage tail protein [Paracoccus indicus]|uniref:phage tail protein n=1 Tax=Paracoccus indicus TaxID=2079229 RepID=UPI000D33DC6B|nr:phage tail protein [Paracoccus indicus]
MLDALRTNPLRPYADDYLRLDSFEWGADVAAEAIGTRAGGTIPRYRVDGVLVFSDGTELEDQLQPLLDAGASRFSRIGGRLALVPATPRASVATITDFTTGQPPEFIRWRSADQLVTEAVARYPAPDRAYESAETPVHVIPGAQAQDGGMPKRLTVDLDFVTDGRQAQRIAKIMAMRSRMQRGITAELFPDSFDLVSGSIATVQLGPPYGSWDGLYEVEQIAPAAGANDETSVTIRLPTVLREESPAIYAWNPGSEEQVMNDAGDLPTLQKVQPPAAVSVVTGTPAAETSGDTVIPGVTAAWSASASASATGYLWEWQTRPPGGSWSVWRSGGALDLSAADGVGVYAATLQWPRIDNDYRLRVRTLGTWGQSAWRLSDVITAAGPADSVDDPPAPSAKAQGGTRIDITATQASDNRARKLLIYGNDVDSPLTATLLVIVDAGASASVTRSETGLTSGTTRFYFARARDQWGNLSGFSGSGSATTA